jgi:flagellar hook-length control protein FliK
MSNLPISSAPQPSGKVANASQKDGANGAGDQDATPFAKVLADKVDKADKPDTEASAGEEVATDNKAVVALDKAEVPVDALNAILSQIPAEMRGASVAERMARLAAGDSATAAVDPAILPPVAALATETTATAATPSADMGEAPLQVELPSRIPSSQSSTAANATGKPDVTLAASEQQVFADALSQRASSRLEPAAAQQTPIQMNTASVSQTAIAAMSGLAGSPPPAAAAQTVSTPLSNPAWGDDFSQKISWLVTQKSQVAELHLNPPNLGPLDVVLKISDNQATALFASPHAAVRDAVENALPKLRELLADNGIMLSNATVGDQSPRDRGTEEFAGRKGNSSSGSISADNTVEVSATPSVSPARRHNGMVDTFA